MLSVKLKELRIQKSLKTFDLAQQLGIDQSLISKFENGQRKPTRQQIVKLSEILTGNPDELLKIWLSDQILESLKEYAYPQEILSMVNDAIAGYEKLLKKKPDQKLPKALMQLLGDIDELKHKIDRLRPLNKSQLQKLNEYFFTDYTYESNKIEGNTLSLQETAMVIKEGLTIGGKSVREHLEAINHKEAIDFVNEIAASKVSITERTVKELHYLILKGIHTNDAGKYRQVNVRITGSKHEPPDPFEIPFKMDEMHRYFASHHAQLHPVVLAADMHQILVGIHPFIDGNGRTSRLLMNLILLKNGYYIANIKGSMASRLKYYQALEKAHVKGQVNDFRLLVAKAVKHSLTEFYDLAKTK